MFNIFKDPLIFKAYLKTPFGEYPPSFNSAITLVSDRSSLESDIKEENILKKNKIWKSVSLLEEIYANEKTFSDTRENQTFSNYEYNKRIIDANKNISY